jgi:hypothetical protein
MLLAFFFFLVMTIICFDFKNIIIIDWGLEVVYRGLEIIGGGGI